MSDASFYGADLALVHHTGFGGLAESAAQRVLAELRAGGLDHGTVVDLACGSGLLAKAVSDAGYDVLGVDLSPAMVALARRQAPDATFVTGSLLDVELPPAVAVLAVGEALNYATDDRAGLEAMSDLARRIRAALHPRGCWLFDVATPGRGGPDRRTTIVQDREDWTLHMTAEEHADGTVLERRITVFRRTGADTYRRTDELHRLRLYPAGAVRDAVTAAGFDVELNDRYTAGGLGVPHGWTVVVARPGGR